MARVAGVVSNAGEDFIDELTSLTVSQYSREVFEPVLKELDKDGSSNLDQALLGALQSLQFGIMNSVIMFITTFVLSKSALILGGIFLWLKGSNVLKKTKNTASRVFSNLGKKTGLLKPLKTISDIALGSEEQRLAMAKMTNDTGNQLMNNLSLERGNQINIKKANHERNNHVINNAVNVRNQSRQQYLEQHRILMQTATYTTSKKHKLVYEKATGQDLKSLGILWNKAYIEKLNEYSNFAKTAEGKIINLATAQLNYMASQGWEASKNV